MEFKISNDILQKAIIEVSRVVSSNSSSPILSGIKIIAEAEQLIIIGGNSDITIEKVIPMSSALKVYQTGSALVSGKLLGELIKKLPGNIYMKVDNNQSVIVQSGEIITKLSNMDPEEYPKPTLYLEGERLRIPSQVIMELIRYTVFATSKAETKPVLTGVHFHFLKDYLTCIATNSQRLSLKKHIINTELTGSYVIPRKALVEVGRLAGNQKGVMEIFFTNNSVVFKTDSLTLYSKLIDGKYPDVSSLLSQETSTTIIVDRHLLLKGVERASIFTNESRNNNITLQIEGKSKIKILSGSSLAGQLEETQECKSISGLEELTVTLDANYLMEALQVIDREEVTLSFHGSLKPILIYPIGDDSHIQLISPVRS
ncbi:DNA polymerase III subunit beta [Ornithinibacillus scapharcae]|uniref:DNA polymerase III subunit beta n=1 Tax=Ornithinibacillus scapharcae TaxID=1147159 RepID=UPI000225B662|nr:DNA polymerase III subunit beta [Ornithinibacillus scapharcae]